MRTSLWLLFCCLFTSCSLIRQSARQNIVDGFYTQHLDHRKQPVYIEIEDEILRIYPAIAHDSRQLIDTSKVIQSYEPLGTPGQGNIVYFSRYSLDVDFITIPLKIRPPHSALPAQMTTNLNGAVFLGYRTDDYILKYKQTPTGKNERHLNHLGFSLGVFTGVGHSFISPSTTAGWQPEEYDGIIWSKGLTGIFAINNVTAGLALGIDNLLDNNADIWIYESRPWLGLAFGLNLN